MKYIWALMCVIHVMPLWGVFDGSSFYMVMRHRVWVRKKIRCLSIKDPCDLFEMQPICDGPSSRKDMLQAQEEHESSSELKKG